MKINDEEKPNILIEVLKERYKVMHNIRQRIENISLWSLGLLIAASGWIVGLNEPLGRQEKCLIIFAVIIGFSVLRFFYLSDLNKGFRNQQKVIVKLEKTLGLYKDVFYSESGSIHPEKWSETGGKEGPGNFFFSTYLLIYTGVGIFVLSLLLTC